MSAGADRDRNDCRGPARGAGDRLLVAVQVVDGALLPDHALVRLAARLESRADGELGEPKRILNVLAGLTVIATSTLSVLLIVVTAEGIVGL